MPGFENSGLMRVVDIMEQNHLEKQAAAAAATAAAAAPPPFVNELAPNPQLVHMQTNGLYEDPFMRMTTEGLGETMDSFNRGTTQGLDMDPFKMFKSKPAAAAPAYGKEEEEEKGKDAK